MNHSVVLYSSRYGAAKEYARMLSESLGCTAYNVKETPLDAAGAGPPDHPVRRHLCRGLIRRLLAAEEQQGAER